LGLKRLLPAAAAVALGASAGVGATLFVIAAGEEDGRLPERWQRGANVTAFLPDAYAAPEARRAMLTARAAGVEVVALVPTWYMADATADSVEVDPEKTPTDASLRAASASAHELDLELVLKPHVDVADGSFRGDIAPDDNEAWFDSYRRMMLAYADLATEIEADVLIVGTELTSMTLDPEPWRELIAAVRDRYDGELSFAANWVDGAETIEFWNELDFIGIDAYMPLQTESRTPTVEQLVEAWGPHLVRMRALQERWDLPILFTEAGYRSRVGAATQEAGGVISEQAQANAYEAAFEALSEENWFEGIWWWEWSGEGLYDPGGFTPEGKLAERVLVDWQGPPVATGFGE
jgi:hypothetical protein